MHLKHFEHLANLERNIIKSQFQRAAKAPVTMSYGAKRMKGNVPQVATITSVTGDVKIKNPYTAGRTKQYPKNPTEKQIREQKGKTAALVANDGLTPAQGGALGLMNEQGAMLGTSGKPLYRPRLKTKTQVM
jgi:hypothetical protein